MELNPEHPVTKALHDQWYKLCALLLMRLGNSAVIAEADLTALVERFADGGGPAIVCHSKTDGIYLTLVSMEDARKKGLQ
jgi:hypothetical protein